MAELFTIANAESRVREPGDFVLTETTKDILRSLDLVRSSPGASITMVAGVPGVGKSHTLKHFTEKEGYDALYLSVVDGEGKPTAVATNLLRLFREKSNGLSLSEMRERLMSYVGRGRVILLDEAQYLERQGAEWVRGLAESGDIDLVLAGDPMLHALVAKVPQLYSRMLRPILIKEVSREDVQAMVEGTAFDTDWAVDGLHSVARLKGGLRNVDNVTRIALLFAGQERPNKTHLKAAIHDMKLSPKGAAL